MLLSKAKPEITKRFENIPDQISIEFDLALLKAQHINISDFQD